MPQARPTQAASLANPPNKITEPHTAMRPRPSSDVLSPILPIIQSFAFKNVSRYNKWQYGLTLSVGYDAFTLHTYYGLNPILKDSSLGTSDISTKIMRIGLIFYLL